MWFKKLYVCILGIFSSIIDNVAKYDLASKIYRKIFQMGVFPKPKNFDEISKNLIVKKDIPYKSSIKEGNNLDIYYPKNLNKKVPVIMWIHGGGYIANSKETVKNYMMALANSGFVVFNINYTLAPKYKYPSQIVQCNEALRYVFKNLGDFKGDRKNIFIGGDSAGAQLASQLAALISNEELSRKMNLKPGIKNKFLRGVVLFCGLYNMESLRKTKFPGIKTYMGALTGYSNFEKFERIDELSTIKYITPNYPSTFITVGDIDNFEEQGKELASSLRSLGVNVVSRFFENKGLFHEYQFEFSVKEARETFKEVIKFINDNSKVRR